MYDEIPIPSNLIILIINRNFIIYYFNSYCKRNGIPLSATLLYLKNVLYWPEDRVGVEGGKWGDRPRPRS